MYIQKDSKLEIQNSSILEFLKLSTLKIQKDSTQKCFLSNFMLLIFFLTPGNMTPHLRLERTPHLRFKWIPHKSVFNPLDATNLLHLVLDFNKFSFVQEYLLKICVLFQASEKRAVNVSSNF